jgi:hypothetical protein
VAVTVIGGRYDVALMSIFARGGVLFRDVGFLVTKCALKRL